MSMTAIDILVSARAKISNANDWGQGFVSARPTQGTFCASQAIWSQDTGRAATDATFALRAAAGIPAGIGIPDWNDAPGRTHAEVLAAFDKAIAALRPA